MNSYNSDNNSVNHNDSYYECLKLDKKYGHEIEFFWIGGIALVVMATIGVIGNALSLITLLRPKFRNQAFYQILITLTLYDTLFIVTYAICYGHYHMACRLPDGVYNLNIERMTSPISDVGLYGSIYTTLAISFERYLGLCHPFLKYRRKSWIYIVPIVIITFSFNIPHYFQFDFFMVNGTLETEPRPYFLRETYTLRYEMWASLFFEDLIPFPTILVLNCLILRTIRTSIPNSICNDKDRTTQEKQITKTVLIVVAVFLFCRSFGLIYFTLCYLGSEEDDFIRKWIFITPIFHFTEITNSSINFFIYCFVGTKFRNELIIMFGRGKKF